jgi:hypothetical protein
MDLILDLSMLACLMIHVEYGPWTVEERGPIDRLFGVLSFVAIGADSDTFNVIHCPKF